MFGPRWCTAVKMDYQQHYGGLPAGDGNMVPTPYVEDVLERQGTKRRSATTCQHQPTVDVDYCHQANPFCWSRC